MQSTVLTPGIRWSLGAATAVPRGDWWLTPAERDAQRRFVVPKRRRDWRAGRWTAKGLLGAHSMLPPSRIGILARSAEDGFPTVEGLGEPAPQVSISHCDGLAVAAVAPGNMPTGCDLERVESRPDRFAKDWFTLREQRRVDDSLAELRDEVVTLIWCVKEAALKATGEGLRMDTRDVETQIPAPPMGEEATAASRAHWMPVSACIAGEPRMQGWYRRLLGHLLVFMAPTGAMGAPPRRIWP